MQIVQLIKCLEEAFKEYGPMVVLIDGKPVNRVAVEIDYMEGKKVCTVAAIYTEGQPITSHSSR